MKLIMEKCPTDMCHASTLLKLDDEKFLIAWFGGTKEGNEDVAIWIARGNEDYFEKPAILAQSDEAHWNPVLFRINESKIIIFYKVGNEISKWRTMYRISEDNGESFGEEKELVKDDFGGKGETSFCFFPYLSYVFLGYVFGKVIRRVPEDEKGDFYKKSGIICGIIAVIWFACCIMTHPTVDRFFNYMIEQYRTPGLAKVVGSFCSIMLVFAIAFWIMPMIEKWKFGYNKLCYYSKQISKIYAVHIGVYYVICGFAAFSGFNVKECLIWSVIVLIVTDLLVQGYLIIMNKIKRV